MSSNPVPFVRTASTSSNGSSSSSFGGGDRMLAGVGVVGVVVVGGVR